ncbi:MAG: AraC family transcriptional regulator [Faecousia sp.]
MEKRYSPAREQKEDAKHGEAFFPVQKYLTRLTPEHSVVTTHWHEEAEWTLITRGGCAYRIDLVDYEVKEGDILFVPPLMLHSIFLNGAEEMRSETYVFHLNFLGGNSTDICSTRYLAPMLRQEFSMPCRISPEHPAYSALRQCFRQLAPLYDEAAFGYELALKSLLLQSVFLLLRYSEKNRSADVGRPSEKLKNVLDYIELHFAEAISVSQLAKLCYFSEYHFMRFFKKHMSMTCVEYINNLRLEKAVERFEQGNTSITEVAMSVGFGNLSYFHRAFKKKYHMTPLSFMKELQNGGG